MKQNDISLKGILVPPLVTDCGQVATLITHLVISTGQPPRLLFQTLLLLWPGQEVVDHVFGLWGQDVFAYITSAPVWQKGTIFGRRLRHPLTGLSDDAARFC